MTDTPNPATSVRRRAMQRTRSLRSAVASLTVAGLALLGTLPAGNAQTSPVNGRATALRATLPAPIGSTTTALGATGALADDMDARQVRLETGDIPLLGGASVLHATTISSIETWAPDDEVSS